MQFSVQGQEKTDVPAQQSGKKGRILPSSAFCYVLFNVLDDAHPHWGGQPALLNSPIQMLMSSGNTLKIHLEIMCSQISGHPVSQSY